MQGHPQFSLPPPVQQVLQNAERQLEQLRHGASSSWQQVSKHAQSVVQQACQMPQQSVQFLAAHCHQRQHSLAFAVSATAVMCWPLHGFHLMVMHVHAEHHIGGHGATAGTCSASG